MLVTLIPHEGVVSMWPKVRPHLAKAVKYSGGRYETDDILVALHNKAQQLWVAFDDEGVKGAVVTQFSYYPRKSVLSILFCAGDQAKAWRENMLNMLRSYAADHGCDALEGHGRYGWSRYMKRYGFRPLWDTIEAPLGGKEE